MTFWRKSHLLTDRQAQPRLLASCRSQPDHLSIMVRVSCLREGHVCRKERNPRVQLPPGVPMVLLQRLSYTHSYPLFQLLPMLTYLM